MDPPLSSSRPFLSLLMKTPHIGDEMHGIGSARKDLLLHQLSRYTNQWMQRHVQDQKKRCFLSSSDRQTDRQMPDETSPDEYQSIIECKTRKRRSNTSCWRSIGSSFEKMSRFSSELARRSYGHCFKQRFLRSARHIDVTDEATLDKVMILLLIVRDSFTSSRVEWSFSSSHSCFLLVCPADVAWKLDWLWTKKQQAEIPFQISLTQTSIRLFSYLSFRVLSTCSKEKARMMLIMTANGIKSRSEAKEKLILFKSKHQIQWDDRCSFRSERNETNGTHCPLTNLIGTLW